MRDPFLLAWAEGADADALVQTCLDRLGPLPAEASLGFLYATDALADALPDVLSHLRAAAPSVTWVGTTGIGLCVTAREIYERPALALLITDLPRHAFHVIGNITEPKAPLDPAAYAFAQAHGPCVALLHGDPTPVAPAVIDAVTAALPDAFINGGLTSSRGSNFQIAAEVHAGGVSGVLFGSEVTLLTDHTQGCSPIGPIHAITDAEHQVLVTLDKRPALEVMKEEMGEVLARDLARVGGYIFAALPVPRSDTGDYLVRNLLALDARRNLVAIAEDLDGQDKLLFCRRDGNTAREDMARMLRRLSQRLNGRSVRGGVYISCLGRGRHQFGERSEELRLIADVLGPVPLVGFFANGEIYNGRLYGYTGVLTLFV